MLSSFIGVLPPEFQSCPFTLKQDQKLEASVVSSEGSPRRALWAYVLSDKMWRWPICYLQSSRVGTSAIICQIMTLLQ